MSPRIAIWIIIGLILALGIAYSIARPWLIRWSSGEKTSQQGFEVLQKDEKERD